MGSNNEVQNQRRRWWALGAICFGLFMSLLDVTIVNVALPSIQHDLNESISNLEWIMNAYSLVFAALLVTSSRLGDIFGRKKVFIFGVAVFTIGSFLCAVAGDIHIGTLTPAEVLNIARGIQGLGSSAMMPLSLALISSTFHGRERGTAFGIWGGVAGLATAIGPLLGGILVQNINWQSIFDINIPIGIIGIAIAAWAIHDSRDEAAPRRIDIFGLLTITASMFCLILALMEGSSKGWTSGYILTLFVISGLALLAFILIEPRIKHPMVDPRLFKVPSFTGAAIAGFTVSSGMYALFFYLSLYLQNLLGFDALGAGLRLLPLSLLVLVGAPLAGRLTDRVGAKWMMFIGMSFCCAGVLLMTRLGGASEPNQWIVLLPGLILSGIGIGIVNPPMSAVAMGTAEPRLAGMASGANNLCRQVGTAFGIALLGALLNQRYNTLIAAKISALHLAGLGSSVRRSIISGIQQAGPMAGSLGLKGSSGQTNPYIHSPLFPSLQTAAKGAFLSSTADVVWLAGGMLLIGCISVLLLVRRKDIRTH